MFKPSRNTVLSYHPVLEKSSFFFLFLHNPNDLFVQKDFLFIYIPIVMIMDEKPFLDINMLELKDTQIEELKKFHKSYFDIDNIINTASTLKYSNEIKVL